MSFQEAVIPVHVEADDDKPTEPKIPIEPRTHPDLCAALRQACDDIEAGKTCRADIARLWLTLELIGYR